MKMTTEAQRHREEKKALRAEEGHPSDDLRLEQNRFLCASVPLWFSSHLICATDF